MINIFREERKNGLKELIIYMFGGILEHGETEN